MIEIESYGELERYLNQKMLIVVSTTWCKPCKEVKIEWNRFLQNHQIQDAILIHMDFDKIQEDEELISLLGVKKIPTFLLLKDGDLQQSVTSSQWNVFLEFIQENFHIEKKSIQITDDF